MLDALRQSLSRYVAFTNEEFAPLAQMLQVRNFDKQVQLVKVGDTDHIINFIIKGLARKYFYRGKDEVITQIAVENDFITSSVSFLSGRPSAYYIETIEPCTFLSLTHANMEKLYRNNQKFERLGRLMITHFFLQQQLWDLDYIRFGTRERFIRFTQNNPGLLQRVPQKYIASYLNMKPETFSRFKHLLAKNSLSVG
ncbi:MAG: Crp/Fnr family transcriptional regulator [Puia sp.]|nr:Crp/Fnr family transcriptional regulator [Puia sp.]